MKLAVPTRSELARARLVRLIAIAFAGTSVFYDQITMAQSTHAAIAATASSAAIVGLFLASEITVATMSSARG